jgi:hypothetical protein
MGDSVEIWVCRVAAVLSSWSIEAEAGALPAPEARGLPSTPPSELFRIPVSDARFGSEDWIEEGCGDAVTHSEVGIESDLFGKRAKRNRPLLRRRG